MTSYKEALKQMLESDRKPTRKRKTKNSRSVSFKTPPLENRERPLKRKHLTPFRAFRVPENDELDAHEKDDDSTESDTNSSSRDAPDVEHKPRLIGKVLDFDVHGNSSGKFEMKVQNVSDWVKETDWTVTPSTSEFSTSANTDRLLSTRREETDESDLINISVDYNEVPSSDLSRFFDCTSSDSSSSDVESYFDSLPKSTTYRPPVSETNPTENASDPVNEENFNPNEDIYDNIIWKVSGGCVAILNENTPLYFHGAFVLSVLYGAVDVLGHTLTRSSGEVEVYSLRGSSYLFLESKRSGEVNYDCERNRSVVEDALTDLEIEGGRLVKKIMEKWTSSAAVIYCKVFASQSLQFLEKHVAQQLLPRPTGHELLCTFRVEPLEWNVLSVCSRWEDLAGQIDANSRVMLCGGKSVGKSTLLRFLVNRLLMTHSKVLVIDLDPGQPEFTVSGCISASIVIKPVFGPNYTHLQVPEKCVFVRNINISYDPNEYLSCVAELLRACADLLPADAPAIVNYMGYSRGLGLNLMASVIPLVSPTLVVQIQSARRQRNFTHELSADIIETHSNLLKLNNLDRAAVRYDLIVLESMADDCDGWQMEPRFVRELGVLSYFSGMLGPDNYCLTSRKVPMFKVSLSDVCVMGGENTNALASVNANMVALCSMSGTANVFNCHGWGIVRGIDTENNELYLLTPLAANDLESVTHLLLGAVNLPPAVYMAQDDKAGLVPYVSLGLITDFNSIPKRSHLHKSTYTGNNTSC